MKTSTRARSTHPARLPILGLAFAAMLAILTAALPGCSEGSSPFDIDQETDLFEAALERAIADGLVRLNIPADDPGGPFYARFAFRDDAPGMPAPPLGFESMFVDDGWVAIVMLRDPSCIPPDFNLLAFFDPPGEHGPGAFGCAPTHQGYLMIEPDAPLGTFPAVVELTGSSVPFYFVRWSDFQSAMAGGGVTWAQVQAMNPLRGTATSFHERLLPRSGDHMIAMEASGILEDGRSFDFGVGFIGDVRRGIRLQFR